MRCAHMLENVPKERSRMVRRVAAEICDAGAVTELPVDYSALPKRPTPSSIFATSAVAKLSRSVAVSGLLA